ncbi:MAG: hypothetical protein ABIP30_09605 [Ferruginibacter sp.]
MPIPFNEEMRLRELYSFDILDTEAEEDYNELANLAAFVCGCPTAMISFIDKDRLWYKAKKKLDLKQTPREESFCTQTILTEDVTVIEDATKDKRFFNNINVIDGVKIRFYASAAIVSPGGYKLGTVCVIDTVAKEISAEQVKYLVSISRQVSKLLDLRKKNKHILKTSEELLLTEKKISALNTNAREKEKLETAYQLNERIAQSLAAIRLNISLAQTSADKDNPYLENSIEEIKLLTEEITDLSKSLSPTTLENDDYFEHMKVLIEDFEAKNKFKIKFSFTENINSLVGYFGLHVFRLLEDIIEFATLCKLSSIKLSIRSSTKFSLVFKYRGFHYDEKILTERKILEANIINRVAALSGKLSLKIHKEKDSVLNISLPLKAKT